MASAWARAVSSSRSSSIIASSLASPGSSAPRASSRRSMLAIPASRAPRRLAQEGARRGIFAAIAPQQEQPRGIGRTEDLRQQRRAIGVAPLKVIDRHHERPAVADAGQQLAQGMEGPPAQLLGVGDLGGEARGHRHGLGTAEDREDPRQRSDVAGQVAPAPARWADASGVEPMHRRRCRAPCTAPTPARSSGRTGRGASSRTARCSRKRRTRADLPTPEGPWM